MRVLAIRGRNLASLEGEFSIDFTEEPLASAGIFAISGPTGAGKSTLLDAMCLALFSRTPRTELAKERPPLPLAPRDGLGLRRGGFRCAERVSVSHPLVRIPGPGEGERTFAGRPPYII